jgi:hypothetical protein
MELTPEILLEQIEFINGAKDYKSLLQRYKAVISNHAELKHDKTFQSAYQIKFDKEVPKLPDKCKYCEADVHHLAQCTNTIESMVKRHEIKTRSEKLKVSKEHKGKNDKR